MQLIVLNRYSFVSFLTCNTASFARQYGSAHNATDTKQRCNCNETAQRQRTPQWCDCKLGVVLIFTGTQPGSLQPFLLAIHMMYLRRMCSIASSIVAVTLLIVSATEVRLRLKSMPLCVYKRAYYEN